MASQFVPTVSYMPVIIRSIIEGYGMGPIRALAQEPVQNSKDAHRGHVHVEYRLHARYSADGASVYMLTVTDRNTTGLQGPILTSEDIRARGVLREGEDWAAFEGMGYTKTDDTALGSRGQGKAAFLYHSDQMMMLYDTLLENGEYRLGVRRAIPSDTVLNPPFVGEEARRVVSTRYAVPDGTDIQLGLEPLASQGTRVIIPHLSANAVNAIHSGELYQWLQRCWWRAVQAGLTIDVVDEYGSSQGVTVPSWWATEPWRGSTPGVAVHENIRLDDSLTIKRIVLLYDESLDEPDIADATAQFRGVQLLRGQQWIETLGADTLSDLVPRDKRAGFRGFVEFDQRSERELRHSENSQHERFDRRSPYVKGAIEAIEKKVREFAEEHGWTSHLSTRAAPRVEQDAAVQFLTFLAPNARIRHRSSHGASGQFQQSMDLTEHWDCSLRLDFPDPKSTRVNWGDYIRNVRALVALQPPPLSTRHCTVSLALSRVDDAGPHVVIESRPLDLQSGESVVEFGDFRIITGQPGTEKIQCPQKGKWRLTVSVGFGGARVASASRIMFVHEDPPTRHANPYALSISVENHTTQQRRIDRGDTIGVQVSVTNRTPNDELLELTSSIGDLLLSDRKQIRVSGTPAGATPDRAPGIQTSIVVNSTAPVAAPRQFVNLPPGRHTLRADLHHAGDVVANASQTLDVQVDPVQPQGWPPFRIEQIAGDGPHPRWQFEKHSADEWVLRYPPAYPLYRALGASQSRDGAPLSGVSAFVVDICAEGIIEWAMAPVDGGDRSRLDTLLEGTPPGVDPDRWEEYCDKMRELADLRRNVESVDDYNRLARDCASRSLNLFQERG